MARQGHQQYLDEIPLGDPKDSLGFAGWLDSYMDEIMTNNTAVAEPVLPSFSAIGQAAEVSLTGDGAPLPAVVPGFPLKHFPSDEVNDFAFTAQPLDYNDRSGSSNSGDSRPDVLQGGALSKAAAKALAVAEKNRKAQKRFRERQKSKMIDSQRQVEQLTAKLEALMQEKSKLESRNCVLEKVVKLKDEQIATMESRSAEPVKVTADGTPVAQDELFELLFNFSNVVKGGIWNREEEGEAHAVPLSKIQERHKEWIEEVAKALMQGAEDPNSPAHARMNELIAVMRDTTTRLGVLNDRLMMTICSTTIVPDPSAPVPDSEYWRRVLEVTNLTHDQKVHIRLIHHELLLKVESILKERQTILDTLSSQGGTWTSEGASLNQAGQFLKQTSHIEALQKNMKAEYQVVFDFELAFYHTVLLPVQQAKMAVQAYPWPTDTLAVCSLILEEIGPLQPRQGQAATPNTQVLLQRMTGSSPFLSLAGPRATVHAPAV